MFKKINSHAEIIEDSQGFLVVDGVQIEEIEKVSYWYPSTLSKLSDNNIYLVVGKMKCSKKDQLDLIRIYASNSNGKIVIRSILHRSILNVNLNFIPKSINSTDAQMLLMEVSKNLKPLIDEYVISRDAGISMFRGLAVNTYEWAYGRKFKQLKENKILIKMRRAVVRDVVSEYGVIKYTPKLITSQVYVSTDMISSMDIKRLHGSYYLAVEFTDWFIAKHNYKGDTLFKLEDMWNKEYLDGITLIKQSEIDELVDMLDKFIGKMMLEFI